MPSGKLKQGHHIVAPKGSDHPANVLVSLVNAAGVPAAGLGEISGPLPGLAG